MSFYFPSFLKLVLLIWSIIIMIFIAFTIYTYNQPDEYIENVGAEAIKNKKKMGIKIYRMH